MSRQRLDAASRFATSAIASASWCRSASKTVDAERATQDKPRKRQTTTRRVLALREFLAAIETNPTVRGASAMSGVSPTPPGTQRPNVCVHVDSAELGRVLRRQRRARRLRTSRTPRVSTRPTSRVSSEAYVIRPGASSPTSP
jgi:hypothetical protein